MLLKNVFCSFVIIIAFISCNNNVGPDTSNDVNNAPVIPSNWVIADTGGILGFSQLAFGNGRFIVSGPQGALSSTNGINWSPVNLGAALGSEEIQVALFVGNRWVAAGVNNTLGVSTNGINWTVVEQLSFGTWGQNMFLRITNTGTAHSTDLINWTYHNDNVIANIVGGASTIRVAHGNGMWVVGAMVFGGSSGRMAYSTNGISWTAVAESPLTTNIEHLAYGNGRFVAINSNHQTLFSSNGINWSAGTDLNNARHLHSGITPLNFAPWAFISHFDGRFIMEIGHGRIAYSMNGEIWSVFPIFDDDSTTAGSGGGTFNPGFVHGGGTFVFHGLDVKNNVGQPSRIVYTRDFNNLADADLDGIFDGTRILEMAFGNRRFVALGHDGTIAYSN